MTQRRMGGDGVSSQDSEALSPQARVLIADPIDLARQGLCGLLSAQQDLEIVASCRTIDDAVYEAISCQPDVVLIGYGFGEQERVEAIRQVSRCGARLPVVAVSDRPELETFLACVRAGAKGYLGGNVDAAALAEAVRTLKSGGYTIEPSILEDLFGYLSRISASSGWATSPPDKNSALGRLSRREREVLRLMAHGMGNKEIAATLGITPGTTKTHLRHIFRKLHVSDRTGAVLAALEIDPQRLLPAA